MALHQSFQVFVKEGINIPHFLLSSMLLEQTACVKFISRKVYSNWQLDHTTNLYLSSGVDLLCTAVVSEPQMPFLCPEKKITFT